MILSIWLFALRPGSGGVRVGHILVCPRYTWAFTMTSLKRASRSGQKPGQVTTVPLFILSLRWQDRFWKIDDHTHRARVKLGALRSNADGYGLCVLLPRSAVKLRRTIGDWACFCRLRTAASFSAATALSKMLGCCVATCAIRRWRLMSATGRWMPGSAGQSGAGFGQGEEDRLWAGHGCAGFHCVWRCQRHQPRADAMRAAGTDTPKYSLQPAITTTGQTSLCERRVAWPAGARAPALRPPSALIAGTPILCYARRDPNGHHYQFASGLHCREVAALGSVKGDREVSRRSNRIQVTGVVVNSIQGYSLARG